MESDHARLRLVVDNSRSGFAGSGHIDRCKESSFSAASPRGAPLLPCSMSLTDEAASPMRTPISDSVSPVDRRSDIRDAHVVMRPSLRVPVELSQRRPVTGVRENCGMPRPKEMPSNLDTIGKRVRWWRGYRKIDRKSLAKLCGMSTTALSDLELDRTEKGSFLHVIAANLRLNPHYLQTGKGEPEAEHAQEPPAQEAAWPLPGVPRHRVEKLNPIERSYAESALLTALAEIEAERRKAKKG